jgi:hypothetical protein
MAGCFHLYLLVFSPFRKLCDCNYNRVIYLYIQITKIQYLWQQTDSQLAQPKLWSVSIDYVQPLSIQRKTSMFHLLYRR